VSERVVRELFDLAGRVAVITGAGSGIGAASARMLARAGASVVCADVDEARAGLVADEIVADGGGAVAVACDVSRRSDVERVVQEAVTGHGRLDVMGNIAGIMQESLVVDTDESELDRVLGVNLKGVFFGCQAAARVMAAQGSGSIVNMSSGAIDSPREGLVAYAMAKAAVAQLTKTLAMEVGPAGVRVNAVAPGYVVTAMTMRRYTGADGRIDEGLRAAVIDPLRERSALRRVGEPDDVAAAVLYLASDASSFVTGQVLRPNGGISMP
jgi:3-oxoacyl-[acyl-carrier protein] reductase